MVFSIFDICLAIIVSQGLFLAITLQLVPKKNKEANRVLSLILFMSSLICLGRILFFKYNNTTIFKIGTLVDATIFLFGPLLYLYFRRLMFKDKMIYRLSRLHFLLPCVYSIYALWFLTQSKSEVEFYFANSQLKIVFLIIEITGLVSMLFYTSKLLRLRKTYTEQESNQVTYNQNITYYIKWTIFAVGVFLCLWLFSFISDYIFNYHNVAVNYNSMWLSVALFMYFIGFYSLAQPQIFRIPLEKDLHKTIKKDRMKPEVLERLKQDLQHLIENDKVYLVPDLNLNQLSEKANTTPNNLSWYLNQVLNKNFYQYINTYRIDEFLERVAKGELESKTILAIALDVGFNSKSTFNKSFKSIKNDTPNNYIKNIK